MTKGREPIASRGDREPSSARVVRHTRRDREPSERELERRFVSELRNRVPRAATVKLTMPGPFGSRGWPDRLVLLPNGLAAFVELKAKGGKLSELQRVAVARLRGLGFPATVAEGKDGVETAIGDIERGSLIGLRWRS